jgi:hypothetical protein
MFDNNQVLKFIKFVVSLVVVQTLLVLPGLFLLPADPVTMYYYIVVLVVSIGVSYYLVYRR